MATSHVKMNVPTPKANVNASLSPINSLIGFCQSRENPKSPVNKRPIHLKY